MAAAKPKLVVNRWSELKRPDDWKLSELPSVPGVYELVAVDANGNPIEIAATLDGHLPDSWRDRIKAFQKQNRGVVYIGKASNIRKRFWKLVRSWRSTKRTTHPHESRKNWNRQPNLHATLPAGQMMCRFIAIGSVSRDKKKAKSKSVSALLSNPSALSQALWPDDDARLTDQPTAAAVMSVEASELYKHEKAFGSLPLLNEKGADRPGEMADQRWAERHLKKLESSPDNDPIEMGDFDRPEIRAIIEEHKRKSGLK